jgi:predicted ATP-grasp superfamily ATP-dependent carboligase
MTVGKSGRVLVFGDDMKIFLAVVRSLGRAGLEVHAAPYDWNSAALKSKYIARIHRFPRYADGAESWLKAVLTVLQAEAFDLIVPCCDRDIIALDLHRQQFAGTKLAIPGPGIMHLLFDKERTRQLCKNLGVPVVEGARLGAEDTAKALAGRYGLPLVIKPRRSYWVDKLDTWGRVSIVDSEAELAKLLESLEDRSRYLVEGYFEGAGVGVSVLAREGKILQAFQHRRLREGRAGASSFRISEPVNAALFEACEKICGHTKLTGVCMFEFRYNLKTHAWILVETNARFWGSLPLPLSLGVDFPRLLYRLVVEQEDDPPLTYPAGIRSRNFILDGFNLLTRFRILDRGEYGNWALSLGGFLTQPVGWLTGRERSDTFVSDDIKPAVWECSILLKSLGRSMLRKAGQSLWKRRGARAAQSDVPNTVN